MKHVKMKKICLAVGSVFAMGIAAQANAGTPVANLGTTLDGFVTGSTAFEPALRAYMRSICSSTLEEFQVAAVPQVGDAIYGTTGGATSNQKAIVWQCSALTTAIGSKTSLTLRKSSGDSGEGVTASTGFYPVNFISTANAQAVAGFTCGTATNTAAETGLSAMNQQTCSYSSVTGSAFIAATNGLAGIADVEPSILNQAINAVVPDTGPGVITTDNIAAAVWGVPVTKTFRDKLQVVQGLTVGSDTEDNMPNLSRVALYSIFSNSLANADALTNAADAGITTVAPASVNGNRIYFLRRPASSGTMASFKAMFGNTPCTATSPWAGDSITTPTACPTLTPGQVVNGRQVLLFQSTGNLVSCLTSLQANARYAVGIASSSNNPLPVGQADKGFRYVKVDGYAPTLINAATGRYPYFTEATFMTPVAGALAPSGDAVTLLNNIKAGLRTPSVIAKVNNDNTGGDQQYGGFKTGYVVTAASGFAPTYPLTKAGMDTNPVIPGTRNIAQANSCQPVLNATGGHIPVEAQF
jgi:hypothetical protein